LGQALDLARRTRGACDPTVGPLVALWREAVRTRALPAPADLEAARALVGWERVELHPPLRAVRLPAPGMRLDLGATGKGFAAQAAWAVLASRGFPRCLVDVGGDLLAGEPPPGRTGWRVLVEDGPVLSLAGRAVATSGPTRRFVEIGSVRYSHIVDPRTGVGLTHDVQVTVVAPLAATADAFATGLSVLGAEEGLALLEATPGIEARFASASGTVRTTPGFDALVAPGEAR
jgi:thiamine biosynthesis lipoprotein